MTQAAKMPSQALIDPCLWGTEGLKETQREESVRQRPELRQRFSIDPSPSRTWSAPAYKAGLRLFVTTPTGHKYEGVRFEKGNCGVSIMRSGEAMEQGLRDCCRSIRIGKILIQSDEETQRAKVYYAKFPPDIYRRKVLLMYPILSTGNTVIEAVKVLVEHGVQPSVIILLSLFSTPHGAKSIIQEFPEITILTTEVHPVAPTHFGQKYFGTD
ncbi:uracil phosphoribosyltransferase homolog [Ciconia boyciana]|uniref:uracil phosphoribosyltransferase homolog n=1 Tax=Ciconia boyciana TaxID=52775 RepID=UPI003B9E28D4